MKKQGNKLKNQFRQTAIWKKFRKQLLEERGTVCQCCGTRTKRLQLHHMDSSIENYDKLIPENFVFVCTLCHKAISHLESIKPENWKNYNQDWVNFYKHFLIFKA